MRPLRVLHLVANRWWTGNAEPALDLSCALRARGHAVEFGYIPGDALEARARAVGFPPLANVALERTARPDLIVREVAALRRRLAAGPTDVVHAHQSHDHWLAALAGWGGESALVRTVHHRRALRRGPASRWLLGRTDAVIAVSEGIAGAATDAGIGPDRLHVVRGAVDVERFRPDRDGRAIRAELGLAEAPVVGCVARLVAGRGHELLLDATRRLRERLPGLRVLLVGRGEGQPMVERRARELALDDVVVFTGYRGDDLPDVLAAMDCFVLLGGGSEESGRAVLEAMATGRPVVAARFGAMPETVVDGETGWLVDGGPTAQADVVAERLASLLTDPTRARAFGAAARRRVESLFTPAGRAAAVEAVYRRVLRRRD